MKNIKTLPQKKTKKQEKYTHQVNCKPSKITARITFTAGNRPNYTLVKSVVSSTCYKEGNHLHFDFSATLHEMSVLSLAEKAKV